MKLANVRKACEREEAEQEKPKGRNSCKNVANPFTLCRMDIYHHGSHQSQRPACGPKPEDLNQWK